MAMDWPGRNVSRDAIRGALAVLLAIADVAAIAGPPPQPPLRFSLMDTTGAQHTPADWAHAHAIVLFFIAVDCPLSNEYVPEMNRLAGEYGAHGVKFYAVASDPTVAESETRRHAQEFAFQFPVLLDAQALLVQHAGATVTPEVAVLSPDGSLMYRGRIDNRVEHLGTHRYAPTQFDLRDALDAVLAGRPVPHPTTTAVGCFMPSRPRTEQ
jgi:thiol-disulfide isomerase/thioredoxin